MATSKESAIRRLLQTDRQALEAELDRLTYIEKRGAATWDDQARMRNLERQLIEMDYRESKNAE